MMLRRLFAALVLPALAACGTAQSAESAESAEAAAEQPAAAQALAAGPEVPSSRAGGTQPAPTGEYECYFHGHYGLQNSSMTSMRILGPAEYEAMDERGRYTESAGTLRMATGALAGRVAHLRESDGKPAIVFLRGENEVDGKPALDLSDTWCYVQPR